jgi:hypothetical protein
MQRENQDQRANIRPALPESAAEAIVSDFTPEELLFIAQGRNVEAERDPEEALAIAMSLSLSPQALVALQATEDKVAREAMDSTAMEDLELAAALELSLHVVGNSRDGNVEDKVLRERMDATSDLSVEDLELAAAVAQSLDRDVDRNSRRELFLSRVTQAGSMSRQNAQPVAVPGQRNVQPSSTNNSRSVARGGRGGPR